MHHRTVRILQACMALAILSALVFCPVRAAEFPDVQEGDWYYQSVTQLSDDSLISGCPDGLFHPEGTASAGAAVLLVMRAAGCEALVPPEGAHWAAPYIDLAVKNAYLDPKAVADPDAPMSRGEIARLAARALGLEPLDVPSPFVDTEDGYFNALYDMGVISGGIGEDGLRRFYPEHNIVRGELSTLVWQVRRVHIHGKQIRFGDSYLDIDPDVPVNGYDLSAFYPENGRMYYSGQEALRVAQGIDVSAYQHEIDWRRVREDGIEFAILRVGGRGYTKGAIYDDVYFEANLRGALEAGLDVGVYFFSQAVSVEEALEEADYVLEHIRGYELSYPVVFDWENISNDRARTDGLDADTLCAAANAFCTQVEQAGYQPMVYFNQYIAYRKYDLGQIVRWPFWLAQYSAQPTFYYDFDMWQYSSSGQVEGIEGRVDMNIRIFR